MNNISRIINENLDNQRNDLDESSFLKQDVVIITSFEGADHEGMRRNILDCMRLKYIIERLIHVPSRLPQLPIRFNVGVAYTEQGDVNEQAFKKIVNADVLIAVVSGANVNVIYELAVRSLIKPDHLILIKGVSPTVLPIYLQTMGHMDFDARIDANIQREIDNIVSNTADELSWIDLDSDVYPECFGQLQKEIEFGRDDVLRRGLQENLQRMYGRPTKWPSFIADLALQLDPSGLLKTWETYYPTSIIRAQWSKRSSRSYEPSDVATSPVVTAGNAKFMNLFGISEIGDPDDPAMALTAEESMKKLQKFMNSDDFEEFVEDQKKVSNIIFFENDFAQTNVPIRFNDEHREPFLRGTVFMPMLIGKKVVGNPRAFHTTYLLVTYLELSSLPSYSESGGASAA